MNLGASTGNNFGGSDSTSIGTERTVNSWLFSANPIQRDAAGDGVAWG